MPTRQLHNCSRIGVCGMNEFNVHLLLEEKWRSIRHIETERHWILAAYSVVVAGVLSFLGQNQGDGSGIPIFAFTILLVMAIFGFLHACRAAWQLGQIQFETREIVGLWQPGNDPLPGIDALLEFWAFGGHGPQPNHPRGPGYGSARLPPPHRHRV